MSINKFIMYLLIINSVFLYSCSMKSICSRQDTQSNECITITGTAEETKDGYYINGYVLEHEEIYKYNDGIVPGGYRSKKIEVIGKIKEINPECNPYEQCRKGPYKVIYDIQSIKIIE